jgi:opacity protein-like surface antigen
MKNLKMAFVSIAAALAASAASAQVQFNVPSNPPIAKSTLTRTEVTADLLIWRASGLADLHSPGQRSVDTGTLEYAQATAKYAYMRASPQFAARVDQINRGGSTRFVVASR